MPPPWPVPSVLARPACATSKRLVKSPKVYLRDSGLLHALLNLPSHDALLEHPALGASWEGWVIAPVSEPFPLSQRAMALPLGHMAKMWQSN